MEQPQLVLTTNPGLEDVAVDELRTRAVAAGHAGDTVRAVPSGVRGRAALVTALPWDTLLGLTEGLRSIHHVLQPRRQFTLPAEAPLEAIAAALSELDWPGLRAGASFRVTTNRRGEHPFGSMDVERVAGQALVDATGAPVDLTRYAVNVRVDLIDDLCTIALQLTQEALSNRHPRAYRPRVALKPNVAWAILRLTAGRLTPAAVGDPFCGSGTLLQEAGVLYPEASLWGSDWNGRAVAGARRNLAERGLEARARVVHQDARGFAAAWPEGLDLIVTNPPYGQLMGRGANFTGLYAAFLRQAWRVLRPEGRLGILVTRREAFKEGLRRAGGFRILTSRVIETSGLFPVLFVLERRPPPEDAAAPADASGEGVVPQDDTPAAPASSSARGPV